MKQCLFVLSILMIVACSEKTTPQIETAPSKTEMKRIFEERCEADDGRLWGVSLCGPLLIVDVSTREVHASEADAFGNLEFKNGAWVGSLPAGTPIANTAMNWAGKKWVMLMYPFSGTPEDMRVLVMHEAWHRIQEEIGLPAEPSNAHSLDEMEGRVLMRLEIQALLAALQQQPEFDKQATRDALLFRAARYDLFPELEKEELALDRNEGLASYTGVQLGSDQPVSYAMKTLQQYANHDAYVRSYAYATGPAYGLLLDAFSEDWRERISSNSPADILRETLQSETVAKDWRSRASSYGLDEIETEEIARAAAHQAKLDALRRKFMQTPRVVLPLRNMQIEFDPNGIVPVEELGTLYSTLTLRDDWGEVSAPDGAIISSDFRTLLLANPREDGLSGPTWALMLKDGYTLNLDEKSGDFILSGNLQDDAL